FSEEQEMVSMSFGDHIEELRARLILAILGLMVGVIITFIPPLDLGRRVITRMQDPAQDALRAFYKERAEVRSRTAQEMAAQIPADLFIAQLRELAPRLELPAPESLKERTVTFPIRHAQAGMIKAVAETIEPKNALISLSPLETMTIFFMVCVVTGLVIASP